MQCTQLADQWTTIMAPRTGDIRRELISEAAEFLGISMETAWDRFISAGQRFHEEWVRVVDRPDAATLTRFYNQSDSELFELIEWHATDRIHYRTLILRDYARRTGRYACADYGSGIGSDALVLADAGFNVTLADISDLLLGFAAFRCRRRGFEVRTIDLKRDTLPQNAYDLVLCLDVLEHIPEPLRVVRQIHAAMREGALLAVHAPFGEDADRPMHVVHRDIVTPRMRALGFRPIDCPFPPDVRAAQTYVKQQLPARDRFAYLLYDGYLKNALGHRLAACYRRVFGKRALPTFAATT